MQIVMSANDGQSSDIHLSSDLPSLPDFLGHFANHSPDLRAQADQTIAETEDIQFLSQSAKIQGQEVVVFVDESVNLASSSQLITELKSEDGLTQISSSQPLQAKPSLTTSDFSEAVELHSSPARLHLRSSSFPASTIAVGEDLGSFDDDIIICSSQPILPSEVGSRVHQGQEDPITVTSSDPDYSPHNSNNLFQRINEIRHRKPTSSSSTGCLVIPTKSPRNTLQQNSPQPTLCSSPLYKQKITIPSIVSDTIEWSSSPTLQDKARDRAISRSQNSSEHVSNLFSEAGLDPCADITSSNTISALADPPDCSHSAGSRLPIDRTQEILEKLRSQSASIKSKAQLADSNKIKAPRSKRKSTDGKENRLASKRLIKADSQREREHLREIRRQQKEEAARNKAREKELASVNRLRTNRKETCTDMIVDIDNELVQSELGQQLQLVLSSLNIACTSEWKSPLEGEKLIKWRRKVQADFDSELGYFVPIPSEIRSEDFVLVYLPAIRFVLLVLKNELDKHVEQVNQCFESAQIIYVVEGLSAYTRKLTTKKRRDFNQQVEEVIQGSSQQSKVRRTRRAGGAKSDEEQYIMDNFEADTHFERFEEALIELQILHNCLVFQTSTAHDSAEWIAAMTQDLSMIPQKQASTNIFETICMEAGQIVKGKDPSDTFSRTIQQMKYMTPTSAGAVVEEFGTIDEMMRRLYRQGHKIFVGLGGQTGTKKLGDKTARQLEFVFTSTEPDQYISDKRD
ncbi:uncharacterized protein V1516DRAFT_679718 [Lipomyces oligophaga]|uniref:uncharacterized protein n=1 Tax=Lipomyces oligophaga TaxID=45792 RepID=UPI0034CF0662